MKKQTVHGALQQTIVRLPEMAIAAMLHEKFETAGLSDPRAAAKAFARHIVSKKPVKNFEWDDDADVTVVFDEKDVADLTKKLKSIIDDFPNLILKMVEDLAKSMLERSERDWRAYRRYEEREFSSFKINLENRWGPALDKLRILHSMSLNEGENFSNRIMKSRAKNGRIRANVSAMLHVRACQITAEIITLLENGFADGALARWRTLHEVVTVAVVIADGDDTLASRYLDHEAVETKRTLDLYLTAYADLGQRRPSKRDIAQTIAAFEEVKARHGPDFVNPLGWASVVLNNKSPRFSDLERAAGRAVLRSHYKMASYNVHASSKALFLRIGMLEGQEGMIAGASNAGLDEGGQHTAFALALITYLVSKRGRKIDQAVIHKVIADLRDQAVDEFAKTGKQLQAEDDEIRSALASEFGDDAPSFTWG